MGERTLAGRYELLEPLGSGATGKVWRATDRSNDRTVALKLLHGNLLTSDKVREQVESEARRISTLTHENIAAVYDFGFEDGIWIAEELVDGVSLASYIDLDPLPVPRSARIGRQILAALEHAHSHDIVHGDVKPTNVIVTGSDEVKVLDFGIAAALSGAGRSQFAGHYAAPEVADGKPPTPLSDVYSVGCLLYEALAGHPPYDADNVDALADAHRTAPVPHVREARADVGEGYEGILLKAMAKYPGDRYPSAKHMDAAIADLRLDHDQDTPPAVITHRSRERERVREATAAEIVDADPDRTILWAILGVAAALLIALLAVVVANREPAVAPTPEPTPIVITPAPDPVVVPVPPPPVVEQPQPTPIVITPAPAEPTPAPEPDPEPEVE